MPGQDPPHHRELERMRRVVEHVDLRLGRAGEERLAGGIAEALRNDHADSRLSPAHLLARGFCGRLLDHQALVGHRASHDAARDRAAVLVDDGHGNPGHLRGIARSGKERPEERRDRDRHRETHDDRAAIGEEQQEILADHRDEHRQRHQSRRLLPVSVRNTSSSVAVPPAAADPTRARSPGNVSSATTRP